MAEQLAKYQQSEGPAEVATPSARSSQDKEVTAARVGQQLSRGGVLGFGSIRNSTSGISSGFVSGGRTQLPNVRIGSNTVRPPSPGHLR